MKKYNPKLESHHPISKVNGQTIKKGTASVVFRLALWFYLCFFAIVCAFIFSISHFVSMPEIYLGLTFRAIGSTLSIANFEIPISLLDYVGEFICNAEPTYQLENIFITATLPNSANSVVTADVYGFEFIKQYLNALLVERLWSKQF
jgi:hypothetical protein